MRFIKIAALSAALAVALGAFGAHSLKSVLGPDQLLIFETGVRYHFYHSFALLFAGLLSHFFPSRTLTIACGSFIAGICCFSGSLYLLSTRTIIGLENVSMLGPITPVGGLLFIIGWIYVFLAARKIKI